MKLFAFLFFIMVTKLGRISFVISRQPTPVDTLVFSGVCYFYVIQIFCKYDFQCDKSLSLQFVGRFYGARVIFGVEFSLLPFVVVNTKIHNGRTNYTLKFVSLQSKPKLPIIKFE